jgi:polyvinyl alcohol dehydrogenase (cytochrome)
MRSTNRTCYASRQMKRATLFWLLACSALLASCSGDDELATPSDEIDGGAGTGGSGGAGGNGGAGAGGTHANGGMGGSSATGGGGGMGAVPTEDAGLSDAAVADDASSPDASDPLDAEVMTDAETDAGADAELPIDAALPEDAEVPLDAALPEDAAIPTDAGMSADASMMMDTGTPDAGGETDPGSDSGADAGETDPGSDPHDWPSFGGDLNHSRTAAAETEIDSDSASSLALAWRVPGSGVTGTPAVVDGVVYFADWAGNVHARNVGDGSAVWSRTLPLGFTSSPCVAGDLVYFADRHATVYALERATGAIAWQTVIDTLALTALWSSPVVADGVLIIGTSSYGTQENRSPLPQATIAMFRGAVLGLNAETGGILWRFETTRPVGQPDIYGPGVSVWGSAAIDTERKALFVGTGNGYATPVSPYSDALLAIDYRTGVLAWHSQFTAFDAYSSGNPGGGPDYDIGATPNLFTIDDDGIPRDVVGVGDKAGIYRVLDRDSGELIWSRTLEQGFFISSRKTGGIIAPAAYSEGRIFVASNTSSSASKVWALDADTGTIDWVSASIGSVNFGGPAVANDVVFFGGSGFAVGENRGDPNDLGVGAPGSLIAFEASTGSVLRNITLFAGRGGGFSIAHGRVLIGSGFSFFAVADEPLTGAVEAFSVTP